MNSLAPDTATIDSSNRAEPSAFAVAEPLAVHTWQDALAGNAASPFAGTAAQPLEIGASRLVSILLDDTPFPKYLADVNGIVLIWNRAAEQLLGYRADEIVGKDSRLIMPDVHRANVPKSIERIRRQKIVQVESVRRHKDGHLVDVLVTAVGIETTDGRFVGYLIHLRDKRVERAILAENALLAQMLRASPIPIMGIDIDGFIRTWNAAAERLFGYAQSEASGQHCDLLVPERLRHESEQFTSDLGRAETIDIVTHRCAKGGREIPVNMIGTPLMNSSGVATGHVLFYRDISEQLRAQQQLRESEGFSRGILKANLDWLTVLDERFNVIYSNRDDVGSSDRPAHSWLDLWPPDQRPGILAKLSAAISQQRGSHMAWRCEGPGTKAWYELWVALLPRKASGEQHILVNARDVTERKATEDHIALIMKELSHRAKNLLSVIGAMAHSTAEQSTSLTEFESTFLSRMHGLAASHDLLVQRDWRGATFRDLVRQHLKAFVDGGSSRLTLVGDDFLLTPAAAQALGMAFHELATNATKYGALANARGQITVTCSRAGERFLITWTEDGGPSVVEPKRHGFGRIVVEEMISEIFNCKAQVEFRPKGIIWSMSAQAPYPAAA